MADVTMDAELCLNDAKNTGQLANTINRKIFGHPVIFVEVVTSGRYRTLISKFKEYRLRVQNEYRINLIKTGESPADIDYVIEFRLWNHLGKGEWVDEWGIVKNDIMNPCDKKVFHYTARLHWDVVNKSLPTNDPYYVQGQEIDRQWQTIGKVLFQYPTFLDYLEDVKSVFPQDYEILGETLRQGSQDSIVILAWMAARDEAFIRLLPMLGLNQGEISGFKEVLDKMGNTGDFQRIEESTPFQYLYATRSGIAFILDRIADGFNKVKAVSVICSIIRSGLPDCLFYSDEAGTIAVTPFGDEHSYENIELNLKRKQCVPFEYLIRYPDLMARYGVE